MRDLAPDITSKLQHTGESMSSKLIYVFITGQLLVMGDLALGITSKQIIPVF
jgi:hypothetical protein